MILSMIRVFTSALLALVAFHSFANDCVKLDIYVKDRVSFDNTKDHPCGYIASQCLKSINFEDVRLEPILAFEISNDGRIIKKWPLPVDAQVYSVSGESIVVGYPNYEKQSNGWESPLFVQIKMNGSVLRHAPMLNTNLGGVECSKITSDNIVSSMYCRKYKDQDSGSIRFIAFPEVCT